MTIVVLVALVVVPLVWRALLVRRAGSPATALAALGRLIDDRPRHSELILVCPRCGWSASFAGQELVVIANGDITVGRTVVHRCRQAA